MIGAKYYRLRPQGFRGVPTKAKFYQPTKSEGANSRQPTEKEGAK
jgi:hypothetical protein